MMANGAEVFDTFRNCERGTIFADETGVRWQFRSKRSRLLDVISPKILEAVGDTDEQLFDAYWAIEVLSNINGWIHVPN